jgi:hypothetical protein
MGWKSKRFGVGKTKKVKCYLCGRIFEYISFGNAIKHFCTLCAKTRNKESKKRHLFHKKEEKEMIAKECNDVLLSQS